jgi:rhodanese-related sulfurtransferase
MEVSPTQAQQLVGAGALLLDVREDDEWRAGHAPDATHLPMSRIGAHVAQLPTDRLIVCVCHVGARSAAVAEALTNAGFSAANLVGGMDAWAAQGLPVVN